MDKDCQRSPEPEEPSAVRKVGTCVGAPLYRRGVATFRRSDHGKHEAQ